jgi:hypothetical protein
VYAVVPVLGTAFFIWAYSGGLKELRAPPARVLIFFGKISYSLYLWHWPIIVLARPFAEDRDLSPTELGCLIIAAVGVSYLSYRYLEQPVRKRALFTTRRNLFAAAAVASVLLLALGIAGVISAGFPQRLDPRITTVAEYANYNIRQLYRLGDCFLTDEQRFSDLKRAICAQREPDKKNVLIWGDSFAAHHFFGLQQLGMQNNIHFLQANKSSCAPLFDVDTSVPNCREFNDGVRSLMESERLDGVIVSAAWRAYVDQIGPDIFFVELHNTMARMLKSGASVFIFGPPIEYKKSLPQLLSRFAITGLEKFDSAKYLNPENFPLDDRMAREFTPIYGLQYLSILETICKEGRSCPFLIQNSVPMQWDNVHLTAPASLFMASELFPAILAHLTKKLMVSAP